MTNPISADKKYTYSGDNDAEKLVAETLSEIASVVKTCPVYDRLKYIVLGGGYGRGEGGVLKMSNGGVRLYNDMDFFVLTDTDSKNINAQADQFFKSLSLEFSKKLGIDIDFSSAMNSKYAARRTNMMMFRHMAQGGRVIIGNENLFVEEMKYSGNLPPIEFAKLMFNRCSGLLFAREKLAKGTALSESDSDFVCRNISKAVLACGETFLESRGISKFHTFEILDLLKEEDMPENLKRLPDAYRRSVEYKKYPRFNIGKDIILRNFEEALGLCSGIFSDIGEFMYSREREGVLAMIKRAVRLFRVRKYFPLIGFSKPTLMANPYAYAAKIAIILSGQNSIDYSSDKEREFVKIWRALS